MCQKQMKKRVPRQLSQLTGTFPLAHWHYFDTCNLQAKNVQENASLVQE